MAREIAGAASRLADDAAAVSPTTHPMAFARALIALDGVRADLDRVRSTLAIDPAARRFPRDTHTEE